MTVLRSKEIVTALLSTGREDHYASLRRIRRTLGRLFGYVGDCRAKIVFVLLTVAFLLLVELAPAQIIRVIVDRAIVEKDIRLLLLCFSGLVLLSVLIGMASFARGYFLQELAQRIVLRLRSHVQKHLQYLHLKFYDNEGVGRIMTRVTEDTAVLQEVTLVEVASSLFAPLQILIIMMLLFVSHPLLAILVLIPVPLCGVVAVFFMIRIRKNYRQIREQSADVGGMLQDNLAGIREVKIFGREEFEAARFRRACREYMRLHMRNVSLMNRFLPMMNFVTGLGGLAVMGYGGYLCIREQLSTGGLVQFYIYMGMFYMPVLQLGRMNFMLQRITIAADRVFELLDMEVEDSGAQSPAPFICGEGAIHFRNLCFSYVKDETVLHDISLEIPAGRVTALVGPSGAGKSTLVKLIPRFYAPDTGAIEIDGQDILHVQLATLRQHIGMVLQETMLFNDTVHNNILYGRSDAGPRDVVQAARLARAHDFIRRLPHGYDTVVGERGVKLSGGERQRIAIARVLLKDPRILILDEATSSIDTETENLIQEAIAEVMKGRTCVVIAHRLSTVQQADRIVLLDRGRILEQGTHESLYASGGCYTRLYDAQFAEASKIDV